MGKYLSRIFNAMRLVRVRLPSRSSQGLLAFGTTDELVVEPKSLTNFGKIPVYWNGERSS